MQPRSEDDIAIVGMSCQTAGAEGLSEFWDILCEGKSQHTEVPAERFGFDTCWREPEPEKRWYGNFVKDADAFDHKFFRKSPREVASQDPQQRLLMQVAYQAVEQSGYFRSESADMHIGCFIGACATEYENNVACHAPNAFTATGNLRSFIAGKISHYFGWTGPSLTLDTACSASGVAIHQACRAIIHGECSAALAGGVAIMTNPLMYQNLAGASFLSPTGQCKPFDARADGYCRGEAIAAIFLKKMSTAIADGDTVFGSIASTAVYQNENSSPIVVPNVSSLSRLFEDVTCRANLDPGDITVVEAHGTGTPVGDPAEYQSIRQVFGSLVRNAPLPIGSVKGLVGHTEGASGVIAAIKLLLMLHYDSIPPQASFTRLSPRINASPEDRMEVRTELKPWQADFKAALINNYGASGSNASIVITEAPKGGDSKVLLPSVQAEGLQQLFQIRGLDDGSIRRYCDKLLSLVRSPQRKACYSVAAMAFALSRLSNCQLKHRTQFSCGSFEELRNKLENISMARDCIAQATSPQKRPVVLCFGGQNSTFIGLDKVVFDNNRILQHHLDECDYLMRSLDLGSIYPEIFQEAPVQDIVRLQLGLFSLQYACAKSWIDCGVKVAALVGHSFGEITALCISGVLSLSDTIRLVAGRAKLIRDLWGADSGAMIAVEADPLLVERLVQVANECSPNRARASIACFNGPRNFTVAGSQDVIDQLELAKASHIDFKTVRMKRLNVTHAFHCDLVDPLLPYLEQLMQDMTIRSPSIPLEQPTKTKSVEPVGPKFAMEHMRKPVFFTNAICRIGETHPTAVWLEAGSRSSVTAMVSKSLDRSKDSHFQAVNITSGNGWQNLVDSTLQLWQQDVHVQFWAHHKMQSSVFPPVILPSYQFEKSRHWMELRPPPKSRSNVDDISDVHGKQVLGGILTFVGYQDKKERCARFKINTSAKRYEELVSGHCIASTAPICPATLELEMVVDALQSLQSDESASTSQTSISNMNNQSPICLDTSRVVWLELQADNTGSAHWSWRIFSHAIDQASSVMSHATGDITLRQTQDKDVQREWSRYERLVSHSRCLNLLDGRDADEIVQGSSIYRKFSEVVDYSESYQGLQRLVGKGAESAGRVCKRRSGETVFDFHLADCFSQVGGIWVNCMTDRQSSDIYIANGIDKWIFTSTLNKVARASETWDIFASHHKETGRSYLTDLFIFDSNHGTLVEVVIGINYAKVSKASMSKMLSRLTASPQPIDKGSTTHSTAMKASGRMLKPAASTSTAKSVVQVAKPERANALALHQEMTQKLRTMLSNISGVEPGDIRKSTELAEIGVDSLTGMEVARDIESVFSCSLPTDRLAEIHKFSDLTACVQAVLGIETDDCSDNLPVLEGSERDSSSASSTSSARFDSIDTPPQQRINVRKYLEELLGIDSKDIAFETPLDDLGVDSLLSFELRADLLAKFEVQVSEDLILDRMTVGSLDELLSGCAHSLSDSDIKGTEMSTLVDPSTVPRLANKYNLLEQQDTAVETARSVETDCSISQDTVLSAFETTKSLTDRYIEAHACVRYLEDIMPRHTQLCLALILEAFEKLGCPIRNEQPDTVLNPIRCRPEYSKLADCLYEILEREGRLIDIKDSVHTRTAIAAPKKSSNDILHSLIVQSPQHENSHRLIHHVGSRLADVLAGDVNGIQLIFGSEEGRQLVSWLYGDFPFNKLSYEMMADFLRRMSDELPQDRGPIKILEMGAGTGGTTKMLVPFLADLGISIEYIFTDLSASMVAAARKKYKQYPFMKFEVHDIEQLPAEHLRNSQHIVIASNAIHATHSLTKSANNIRQVLRDDGFLIALEMTERMYWIDIIFGVFEGWWLFDDGRPHAIADERRWKGDLQSAGFGHVDWTDGTYPEVAVERIIIAHASKDLVEDRQNESKLTPMGNWFSNLAEREATVEQYVQKYTAGFSLRQSKAEPVLAGYTSNCVLVTGASGSLGSHVVAHLTRLSHVKTVVCLNRRAGSNNDPISRQRGALTSRGISLGHAALEKLKIIETESSKPNFGLLEAEYQDLVRSVTHIIHNAWPMSAKRPLKGFEAQFQVMRNMIELASGINEGRGNGFRTTFQFISSIAVVGHYPLWSGSAHVPESSMEVKSALHSGYAEAKLVCERMLDMTLRSYSDSFQAMSIRIGQIAGSESTGYWNPSEHLSMLLKSSQTLRCLPRLQGVSMDFIDRRTRRY